MHYSAVHVRRVEDSLLLLLLFCTLTRLDACMLRGSYCKNRTCKGLYI
jgi:hypothetical protein